MYYTCSQFRLIRLDPANFEGHWLLQLSLCISQKGFTIGWKILESILANIALLLLFSEMGLPM